MNVDLPNIPVPESLTLLCSQPMANSRSSYSRLADIIEKEAFLKKIVPIIFVNKYRDGNMLELLSNLGWEGFRNHIAEMYLYHQKYNQYPYSIELDEVYDVLDIERRFDFLFNQGNSRVFMLGMYLKLCSIEIEKRELDMESSLAIPSQIDEILIKSSIKTDQPDWLILTVWAFLSILGESRTYTVLKESKGDMQIVLNLIERAEYEQIISILLKYGNVIEQYQIFSEKRV